MACGSRGMRSIVELLIPVVSAGLLTRGRIAIAGVAGPAASDEQGAPFTVFSAGLPTCKCIVVARGRWSGDQR